MNAAARLEILHDQRAALRDEGPKVPVPSNGEVTHADLLRRVQVELGMPWGWSPPRAVRSGGKSF
jgi:hypothetical protein